MGHIGRAKLRGRKLLDECYRATICHDDFAVEGMTVDTCWGLVDRMTEEPWGECRACRAYCHNVPGHEHWSDYIGEVR